MSDLKSFDQEHMEHLTDQERAKIWKDQIERSLTELEDLREQLNPVPFTSPLWEEYRGAYGDIREDVAFLFCPPEILPEMEKLRRLDFAEKEDEQINFDNLCENLSHQLSLYDAIYLTMPYLVLFLEKKRRIKDYQWQLRIIMEAGIILSTDLPCWQKPLPEEIQTSYEKSKELLQEMTKEFLREHFDKLKQEDSDELLYLSTALLAIFGNPEAANLLVIGSWQQISVACPNCDYYDEIEVDGIEDREMLQELVEPAESVIGDWDKKSFDNTYLWFTNLVHEFGLEEEWKLPFYFGTYTCPECGEKGILIDWMKDWD